MALPSQQCDVWSNQGATVTAQATHEVIRNALASSSSAVAQRNYDAFLQGSYRNSTNIRGDSDVDIVLMLRDTFYFDSQTLNVQDQVLLRQQIAPVFYPLADFDADVQRTLRNVFGTGAVQPDNKCIRVQGGGSRLRADVVVASVFRRYWALPSSSVPEPFVEGIEFFGRNDGIAVVNYPKLHFQFGADKNGRTNSNFKPSVRMFKNARSYLIDKGVLTSDVAPSYFLECFLYNVPDRCYLNSRKDTYWEVLTWLRGNNWEQFVCQNQQDSLFGYASTQWDINDAVRLVQALMDLWDNW
jgi:hypothetical protein